MSNNVKIMKLTWGEEIVATIKSTKDDVYVLENAVRFIMSDNGVGMVPWMPFAKAGPIHLPKSSVALTAPLEEEIENAYNAQFSSLILPSKKLKLVTD